MLIFLLHLLRWALHCFFFVRIYFFLMKMSFVANLQSPFMQQDWERSFIIKQFFKAEHFFFGQEPAGYHIISVLLHIGCAAAALQLLKLLLKNCTDSFNAAQLQHTLFIFFLFFLITPVHSEPLCYILAQGVLIFTLFAVLCVLFFIKAITANRRFFVLSLLFFVITLLCYEISWMIPFINLTLVVFYSRTTKITAKGMWMMAACFFMVLAIWFYIKTTVISASLVADYSNMTAANIGVMNSARNGAILFLRNFLPPVKDTFYFILAAFAWITVLITVLFWLFKKQPKLFSFVTLLVVLTVLSFAPTSPFGIDSHDSESERYVYFSSVFAMMLLAVVISKIITDVVLMRMAVVSIFVLYAAVLFNTINYYKRGGAFSQKYLAALNTYTHDVKTVYTVNQPSQFNGALLLRALTRLPEKKGDNYTVLSEYMKYLYHNNSTAYITFSAKELNKKPPLQLKTVQRAFAEAALYFPETKQLVAAPLEEKSSVVIAVLRNDSLYIFR